jgi:hypothetical protein
MKNWLSMCAVNTHRNTVASPKTGIRVTDEN